MTRTQTDVEIAALSAKIRGSAEHQDSKAFGVNWIHRQAWPEFGPQSYNEPVFDNIEIAPDLFYTAVGRRALNTLGISC